MNPLEDAASCIIFEKQAFRLAELTFIIEEELKVKLHPQSLFNQHKKIVEACVSRRVYNYSGDHVILVFTKVQGTWGQKLRNQTGCIYLERARYLPGSFEVSGVSFRKC